MKKALKILNGVLDVVVTLMLVLFVFNQIKFMITGDKSVLDVRALLETILTMVFIGYLRLTDIKYDIKQLNKKIDNLENKADKDA